MAARLRALQMNERASVAPLTLFEHANRWCRILTAKAALLLFLGALLTVPHTSAAQTTTFDEVEPAGNEHVDLVVCHPKSIRVFNLLKVERQQRRKNIVCSVYHRSALSELLWAKRARAREGIRHRTLSAASSELATTPVLVYFYGTNALNSLSPSDVSLLLDLFRRGAVVGFHGADHHSLVKTLALDGLHDDAALIPGAFAAHFVHNPPETGVVEHLQVDLGGHSFAELLSQAMDWEEENHADGTDLLASESSLVESSENARLAQTAPAVDGWNYCKSYSYSGQLYEDDRAIGGYNINLKFHYVPGEEVDDRLHRWRLLATVTSNMSNYWLTDTNDKKAHYMRSMGLHVTLGDFRGNLAEFAPGTSVGSESRTSTIGGMITTSQGGVNYSTSVTNSTQDVTIRVDGNKTSTEQDAFISWNVDFLKCRANNWGNKLKRPAASARGLWEEQFALIAENATAREGIKVTVVPSFTVEGCRCGSGSCPIRHSVTRAWTNVYDIVPESCN